MADRNFILSQVISGSLNTVADEMSAAVTRSARSPVFNEAHDFTTAIFEMHGLKSRLVAQSPGCTLHLYAVAGAVDRAIEAFKHDLQPGDVILASDPYDGGTHIPDLVIVTPVFRDRKPVFFPAVRAHMGDVGGPVAGGYNPRARDIWQDGLVMPPIKIVERGERRSEMLDLLIGNNRIAHWIEGDLNAMIGACQMAARRICGLLDRYGLDTVRAAVQSTVDYSERRVRAEIASWPDGVYLGETFVDHDFLGRRDIKIACKATVAGANLTLDFSGSDPQTRGFINSPIANTLSFIFIALTTCCDEDIPINEGCMTPVTCIIPEGSVINPIRPAPVGTCTCSSGAEVTEAVLLALQKCAPERVGVNVHKMPLAYSYGSYEDGRKWVFMNFIGYTGGAGAAYETDGWGLYPPLMTGVTLPSIEMTELQYPTRILKHEYIADTTGAGRWRGAPGLETFVQHLVGSQSSVMMEGVRHTAKGFCGGEHGASNLVSLLDGADAVETVIGEVAFMHFLPAGGMIRTIRGGGGGWGPAIEREPDAVREDVLDGYHTREGAWRDYGVALTDGLDVDHRLTREERARRAELR